MLKDPDIAMDFLEAWITTMLYHIERPNDPPRNKGKGKGKGKKNTNQNDENNGGKKKEKRCFICDEPGHLAKNCPQKKRQVEPEIDAEDRGTEE